jgi:hypothetical protein
MSESANVILVINYDIIMKSISTLMYFHYKLFINEKCLQNENDKFQKSLSQPSIIDARAHYWAAAWQLRSPDLGKGN